MEQIYRIEFIEQKTVWYRKIKEALGIVAARSVAKQWSRKAELRIARRTEIAKQTR